MHLLSGQSWADKLARFLLQNQILAKPLHQCQSLCLAEQLIGQSLDNKPGLLMVAFNGIVKTD